MEKKVNFTYNELRVLTHAQNKAAFQNFLTSASRRGIRPGAPWEAVLQLFIEYKAECEAIMQHSEPEKVNIYMQGLEDALSEARAIVNN